LQFLQDKNIFLNGIAAGNFCCRQETQKKNGRRRETPSGDADRSVEG